MAETIQYTKLSGAGNVYIVVDGRAFDLDWGDLSRSMLSGVIAGGSDGLVVVCRSDQAQIGMRIFNPDGSEAEISGNGARLMAKFVLDKGIVALGTRAELTVETRAGVSRITPFYGSDGLVEAAKVGLGTPIFDARRIGLEPSLTDDKQELVGHELNLKDGPLSVTCLSVGNPHAVHIAERRVDEFPLRRIGAQVEVHPLFTRRTNFEVANVLTNDRIRARIFERGVGETASSGTCSTAAAAACRRLGLVGDKVTVELDGGDLEVVWENGEVYNTGPTEKIDVGEWQL